MSPEETKTGASQKLISWTPLLDAGWKLSLFISIVLYTLGLVISNLHAQRFGRYNLGLDKAEYIIVGLLWVFLAATGLLIFVNLRRAYKHASSTAPVANFYVKNLLGGLFIVVVLTPLVAFLFCTTFGAVLEVGYYLDKRNLMLFGVVLATGAAIDTLTRRVVSLAKEGGLAWKTLGTFHGFFYMVQRGWYLPMTLIVYALFVFPLIPAAFGGGALQSAEIFIKPEGKQLFEGMKLNVGANGSIGRWDIVVELP